MYTFEAQLLILTYVIVIKLSSRILIMKKTLIIIPSRMQSTRLPGKPLLDMEGIPMVIRVAIKAKESNVGDVLIACCDKEVYEIAKSSHVHGMGKTRYEYERIGMNARISTIQAAILLEKLDIFQLLLMIMV